MSNRPVHYRAAGTGGLAFKCYFDELKRHLGSKVERPIPAGKNFGPRGTYTSRPGFYEQHLTPPPTGHTDLRRVTCLACWREIARMAREESARLNQKERKT